MGTAFSNNSQGSKDLSMFENADGDPLFISKICILNFRMFVTSQRSNRSLHSMNVSYYVITSVVKDSVQIKYFKEKGREFVASF